MKYDYGEEIKDKYLLKIMDSIIDEMTEKLEIRLKKYIKAWGPLGAVLQT